MLKQISIVALLVVVLIAAGCSSRRTRQFVVADERIEGFMAGEWLITTPAVVAFRDVIDLEDITDTTMFWVSMRAKRPKAVEPENSSDLIIDSIKISFIPDGGAYWRKPTRSAPYGDPKDKFARKAFDFFGDQGIVIPVGIDSIVVAFDAISLDHKGALTDKSPVEILMVRQERKLVVPLLQE